MLETHTSSDGMRALLLTPPGGGSSEVVPLLESRGLRVTARTADGSASGFAKGSRPELIFIEHCNASDHRWRDVAARIPCIRTVGVKPMERAARENVAGEEPEGRYSNYFLVGFNAFEVILEFGQHYEGDEQPHMHTRIVTAPAYADGLLQLLKTALAGYEQKFGCIDSR